MLYKIKRELSIKKDNKKIQSKFHIQIMEKDF